MADNVAFPMLDQHISEMIFKTMFFADDERTSQEDSEELRKIARKGVALLIGAYGFDAVMDAVRRCDVMKLYVKYWMTV